MPKRMFATGGMIGVALLVAATVWMRPAAVASTITVYASPT
jgi:hypothetical protein